MKWPKISKGKMGVDTKTAGDGEKSSWRRSQRGNNGGRCGGRGFCYIMKF